MTEEMNFLWSVINCPFDDVKFRWGDLYGTLSTIIQDPLTAEMRRLLEAIILFRGRIHLDETGDHPHSLSPENMLRSLALQKLTKSAAEEERLACLKIIIGRLNQSERDPDHEIRERWLIESIIEDFEKRL